MAAAPATFRQEALIAQLVQFTGTERWFRHWSGRFTYTEGVQFLAEQAGAYWLIDLVASWCDQPALKDEEFIVWKLMVKPDRTAIASAEDGDGHALAKQEIAFTDFPLDEITLYLTEHVLLLTSEY